MKTEHTEAVDPYTKPAVIVSRTGVQLVAARDMAELITGAAALGYEHTGYDASKYKRAELHGVPTFKGLVGPMWDGGALRYESAKVYREVSQ